MIKISFFYYQDNFIILLYDSPCTNAKVSSVPQAVQTVFSLFYQYSEFYVKFKSPTFQFPIGNVYGWVYTYLVSLTITALPSHQQGVVECFSPTAELQRLEI